jgi:protein-S-isoprenylcysteine O-methyltransferase Ste14
MSKHAPWWKGTRGEGFVVAQGLLFLLIVFGPRHVPGLAPWPPGLAKAACITGIVLLATGSTLALAAVFRLGRSLTPLPYPKEGAPFVRAGAYALVRHPIYAGAIQMGFGFALLVQGTLTVAYAILLLIFFDVKSRWEERWLVTRHPGYADYRRHVRRLIPFVY